MNWFRTFFIVSSLICMLTCSVFASFTTTHLTTEQFESLLISPAFIATSIVTDTVTSSQDRTCDISMQLPDIATTTSGNFVWSDNDTINFSLICDAASQSLTFVVGQTSLDLAVSFPNGFIDMFIMAGSSHHKNSIQINNLVLDGIGVSDSATASASQDILQISGANLSGSFVLTGQAAMIWKGNGPKNSALQFEILSQPRPPESIPEPATIIILGSGCMLLGHSARKKRAS